MYFTVGLKLGASQSPRHIGKRNARYEARCRSHGELEKARWHANCLARLRDKTVTVTRGEELLTWSHVFQSIARMVMSHIPMRGQFSDRVGCFVVPIVANFLVRFAGLWDDHVHEPVTS